MNNPGNCLCETVTWEITAVPYRSCHCHCKMCRKAHGAAFGTYWFVQPDQIRWTGSNDGIVHYQSSEQLERAFCGACGSVVPYSGDLEDRVVIPAGCHDHGMAAECEIFVADKAPWYDITSDLPQHDRYPAEFNMAVVDEAPLPDAPDGVIRGSCLCGAVELHIDEPFRVVHNCHCSLCRHARAAAHTTNGFTSSDAVRFVRGADHVQTYQLPAPHRFAQAFCDVCGSKLPRLNPDRGVAVTPLGILDDDPGSRPIDNIFVGSKAGWYEITDDLPAFDELPPR